MSKQLKIYAISGLGADQRVFQYLNIKAEIIPLNWIAPGKEESLKEYAHRLAQEIDVSEPFCIMGVSFGGLIASEIAKIYTPVFTVLISSTDVSSGLRNVYGWIGKMGLLPLVPKQGFDMPRILAGKLFGTKNTQLLNEILNDADLDFTKWAVIALTQWKNEVPIKNGLKITGTKDLLIPVNRDDNSVLIKGGSHFMIVDRADEISQIINHSISSFRISQ